MTTECGYSAAWEQYQSQLKTYQQAPPPGAVCTQCHECDTSLYSIVFERAAKVLEMRPLAYQTQLLEAFENEYQFKITPRLQEITYRNLSRIDRVRRISGMYAKAFHDPNGFAQKIPFVGVAAFGSNTIRWDLELLVKIRIALELVKAGKKKEAQTLLESFGQANEYIMDYWFAHSKIIDGLLEYLFMANAYIYIEIFPIVEFMLRHVDRYGEPRTDQEKQAFLKCVAQFIEWYKGQAVRLTGHISPKLDIDGEGLILEGIKQALDGNLQESTRNILWNEQKFTLQPHMYDKADNLLHPVDQFFIDDPVYAGTLVLDVSAKFTYHQDTVVDDKFIVPLQGGNVTNFDERWPYMWQVVNRFMELYYTQGEETFITCQHQLMMRDAAGY